MKLGGNIIDLKKFTPLAVSSKFAICGLPIRVDTYKTCSFNCKYCFSNSRKIMEFEKTLQVGNIEYVKRLLHRIFDEKKVKKDNFLETLIADNITWHCGGMSDPFQQCEEQLKITKQLIEVTKPYGIHILFSTKSDTVYDCDISPDLHTFQLSVSNLDNRKDIEVNVPPIKNRINFFNDLKNKSFKVGIRVQPFIPNITKPEIVDCFSNSDYFTIEGLKLVPQNKEHKEELVKLLNLDLNDFTQMGLLNLKPEIRVELYKEFIERLKYYNIPYSLADNDLHHISSGKCCCGDVLINKSTNFNNTAMYNKYKEYSLDNVLDELGDCSNCKCNNLFTSNRQENCITVEDFYKKRFDRKSSPFSPSFLYTDYIRTT